MLPRSQERNDIRGLIVCPQCLHGFHIYLESAYERDVGPSDTEAGPSTATTRARSRSRGAERRRTSSDTPAGPSTSHVDTGSSRPSSSGASLANLLPDSGASGAATIHIDLGDTTGIEPAPGVQEWHGGSAPAFADIPVRDFVRGWPDEHTTGTTGSKAHTMDPE